MALTAAAFAVHDLVDRHHAGRPVRTRLAASERPGAVLCGLGFGLAIAPVNASMLVSVREQMHGLASALGVVARMIGMLVGISILTAVSLHVFYTTAATLPPRSRSARRRRSIAPRTSRA